MDGTGPYSIMPRATITRGDFSIRAVEPQDIEQIRLWRNAQLPLLRQMAPISSDEQSAYFAAHIWPDKLKNQPSNILVAFLKNENLIGYGGLVHIQWAHQRAEVSFLFDAADEMNAERRTHFLPVFLSLVQELAFKDLHLHRLTTETYETRFHIIPSLEDAGFQQEGRLRQHVIKNGRTMDAILHACLSSMTSGT